MFLFQRFRGATEEPIPPCSVCSSTSSDTKNMKGSVTVTTVCLTCQNSKSSIPVDPDPAPCVICQEDKGPFPEASPWQDSIAPPIICTACLEQSLSTTSTSECRTEGSPTGDTRARARGKALRDLLCIACHRSLPASAFPDGHILESCRHEPGVCLNCIENAIIESLDDDLPQCISCPQCGDAMSALDVWRLSTSNTFQRYEKMMQSVKEQECAVCAESLRRFQFPESRITESCKHAPNTCLDCIQRHINVQLETRTWNQLSCPECPALLEYVNVEKYASQVTFQRYDSLAMRDGICSDPNFRWCAAPECSSGQVHAEGAESPIMICNSCRLLTCFTHQTHWHEGMSCMEFDNPEAAQSASEGSNRTRSGGLLSTLAEMCGRNREIILGGVKRRETDQEKKDRKMAVRLFKEQEEVERKRLQRVEQENRRRVEAEEAEQREEERLAREAQEGRQRRERELQIERERQARDAQQIRARQQQEELASNNLLQDNTKACPGNCGWRIEKKNGCDHMTCRAPQVPQVSHPIADSRIPQVPVVAINSAGYVSRLGWQ